MLENALLLDGTGQRTNRHCKVLSKKWDEIEVWSDQVYMPYNVSPIGGVRRPDCKLFSAEIGSAIFSHFTYGIGVRLDDFSADEGRILVLTTIRGAARHWIDKHNTAETLPGQTFVADCSRTEYWADFNPQHEQVNLTIPHDYLETLWERWYGTAAPPSLWTHKVYLEDRLSTWACLLDYAGRCISETPEEVAHGRMGQHLQEMLGIHLLNCWAQKADIATAAVHSSFAPRYVRAAERYIEEHAIEAPTISEIASAVGISMRALSGAFRQYRRMSPREYLREVRLQRIRGELQAAPASATVASIAREWGCTNLGQFAALYRRRFGELPSETLRFPRSVF